MNYSPKGLFVWDAWFLTKDDEVHMYHLQRNRPKSTVPAGVEDWLGHAVSRDLIHWEERKPAFGPDPKNPDDDIQPWTGCALWHEGRGYMYYTMRGSANEARLQKIGMAMTTDLDSWERYSGNPVIVPDSRWYATPDRPVKDIVDCRDLVVIPDPRGGWLGFFATRQHGDELPDTSVIACVHSDDLIHWEQRPPAFSSNRYACVEVPDVFELNGRWYLTCLTGNWYGNRGIWSDPNIVHGTMYAVADRPEGPYVVLPDNTLIGARFSSHISCRSFIFKGERHVLYTDREKNGKTDEGYVSLGTITTPKVFKTDGDRLYAAYSPLLECEVKTELIGSKAPPLLLTDKVWGQVWQKPTARWHFGEKITGESKTGWGVQPFDISADSFIFEAEITIEKGVAAGLALRMDQDMSGSIVALEADEQVVAYYDAPAFEFAEKRLTPIPRGKAVKLKIVCRLEHIEVFVNEELRLAFSRYRGIGGKIGLFVDRGSATFRNIRFRTLNVKMPE